MARHPNNQSGVYFSVNPDHLMPYLKRFVFLNVEYGALRVSYQDAAGHGLILEPGSVLAIEVLCNFAISRCLYLPPWLFSPIDN